MADDAEKCDAEEGKSNCGDVADTSSTRREEQLTDDPELDDILEDALQDFDRPPIASRSHPDVTSNDAPIPHTSANSANALQSEAGAGAGAASKTPDTQMPDMKGMESLIMSLMTGDTSSLAQQLNGLDLGLDTDPAEAGEGKDFAETLQRTLGDLAQSSQDLQNDEFSEEELIRLVSSFGADGVDGFTEGSGEDDLLPVMHGMMKSLLSKDILYPSLKEISAQYPAWLQNNRERLSQDEYQRYERQQRLMASIVHEFEAEQPTDADDVKRQRFERVLDIMQQMQSLGHPPKELVGDVPKGIELDEDGLPKLPAGLPSPEQCCVM